MLVSPCMCIILHKYVNQETEVLRSKTEEYKKANERLRMPKVRCNLFQNVF